VLAVAVPSVFHLEVHQNNIFFIFKKLFLISTHQKHLKNILKKNFKQKNSKSCSNVV
jgi:hypothetical protein